VAAFNAVGARLTFYTRDGGEAYTSWSGPSKLMLLDKVDWAAACNGNPRCVRGCVALCVECVCCRALLFVTAVCAQGGPAVDPVQRHQGHPVCQAGGAQTGRHPPSGTRLLARTPLRGVSRVSPRRVLPVSLCCAQVSLFLDSLKDFRNLKIEITPYAHILMHLEGGLPTPRRPLARAPPSLPSLFVPHGHDTPRHVAPCTEFVAAHGCLATIMAQAGEHNQGRHSTVFHRTTNRHRCKGAPAADAADASSAPPCDDDSDFEDDLEAEAEMEALPPCPVTGCCASRPCGIRAVLHRDLRLLLARLLRSCDLHRRSRTGEPPRKRPGPTPTDTGIKIFH